jgi:hypothetical protein
VSIVIEMSTNCTYLIIVDKVPLVLFPFLIKYNTYICCSKKKKVEFSTTEKERKEKGNVL